MAPYLRYRVKWNPGVSSLKWFPPVFGVLVCPLLPRHPSLHRAPVGRLLWVVNTHLQFLQSFPPSLDTCLIFTVGPTDEL